MGLSLWLHYCLLVLSVPHHLAPIFKTQSKVSHTCPEPTPPPTDVSLLPSMYGHAQRSPSKCTLFDNKRDMFLHASTTRLFALIPWWLLSLLALAAAWATTTATARSRAVRAREVTGCTAIVLVGILYVFRLRAWHRPLDLYWYSYIYYQIGCYALVLARPKDALMHALDFPLLITGVPMFCAVAAGTYALIHN